ncbi:MAG: beta-hydroxyacyl-ACP dehydratase [Phycisphaerae bacterium]|nr:beta-hydroxyacyl-ACP dehydratase [Phycisphaerae bacterium]
MRFILIDKVLSLDSGKHIQTIKNVSLAEEYLGDHFPTFPVLPGVLLLQGMVESASWLVREAQGFAHSMILMEHTRNVKYKSFLAPGMQINYVVDVKTLEDNISSFRAYGQSGDTRIVEARFALRHFNLADRDDTLAGADAQVVEAMKKRWHLLKPNHV